ncbi:hypothetical protein B296_00052892, partial [Ensete ventricosum]
LLGCLFFMDHELFDANMAHKTFYHFFISLLSVILERMISQLHVQSCCKYLSQGNLRDANNFMDELKKQLEQKQLEIPHSDLIQVIGYLLRT